MTQDRKKYHRLRKLTDESVKAADEMRAAAKEISSLLTAEANAKRDEILRSINGIEKAARLLCETNELLSDNAKLS